MIKMILVILFQCAIVSSKPYQVEITKDGCDGINTYGFDYINQGINNVQPKKNAYQVIGTNTYGVPPPPITLLPPLHSMNINTPLDGYYNPLFGALLLATSLGIPDKPSGHNHPELMPPNPYVALLLSHYGRYLAIPGFGHGLYGYGAVNNYHNNKPFGAYKIYEDSDS